MAPILLVLLGQLSEGSGVKIPIITPLVEAMGPFAFVVIIPAFLIISVVGLLLFGYATLLLYSPVYLWRWLRRRRKGGSDWGSDY